MSSELKDEKRSSAQYPGGCGCTELNAIPSREHGVTISSLSGERPWNAFVDLVIGGVDIALPPVIRERRSESIYCAVALAMSIGIAVAVPLVIPFDGHEYVRSGFAVLDGQMTEHYQWVREPGYPVFAALMLTVGGPRLLIFVQAVLLFTAARLLAAAINRMIAPLGLRVGLVATTATALAVWGYAATALAQVLILVGICLGTLGVARWRTHERGWAAIGAVSCALLASVSAIAVAGLIAGYGLAAAGSIRLQTRRAVALLGVAVAGAGLALLPWYAFKANQVTSRSDSFGFANFWDYQGTQSPLSTRLSPGAVHSPRPGLGRSRVQRHGR